MLFCVLVVQQTACQTTQEPIMLKSTQDYIELFQRGDDFRTPVTGIITNSQPDVEALQLLGNELLVAGAEIREKIVKLLVSIGQQIDPLTVNGADVLRHPQIIALLAGPGLIKPDLGRNAAMDALRKLVTQANLSHFDEAFTKNLRNSPSEGAFLLVAKAKPQIAKKLVDRLIKLPEWEDVEEVKIAQAALGAKDVENEFIAAVETAKDGQTLAQVLRSLGLIGTSHSLKVVAEQLRTPLTIDRPGSFEKSVRLDVLEALLYNFPDQAILYPNNINSDEGYAAAEHFCTITFGVTYRTPRPSFMTYRGYPIPIPQ